MMQILGASTLYHQDIKTLNFSHFLRIQKKDDYVPLPFVIVFWGPTCSSILPLPAPLVAFTIYTLSPSSDRIPQVESHEVLRVEPNTYDAFDGLDCISYRSSIIS